MTCQTTSEAPNAIQPPKVEEQGRKITFPDDQKSLSFFGSEVVKKENLSAQYAAPASIGVSIVQSSERGGRNTVLFDDADLSATYSQFLQHIINIHTLQVNLNRVKDLEQHGAATGKEVLDAETQLANEEAAITEQEAKLKLAGLDPTRLKEPRSKEAWLICEVPENQIAQVKPGTPCTVTFTAFGDKQYKASVDGIGAEVDNITRMVKVRVVMQNPANQFEVGMFANVLFDLQKNNTLSVPVSALVNVQGKDGEDVGVYIQMQGSTALAGVAVTVIDRENVVLVNLVGDIRPEQIAALGEKLNIQPLKKIGEAVKQ